jgi:hypothetical protein
MKSRRFNAAVLALSIVAVATVFAIISSLGDAPIVDEVPHIGAGYSYVTQLDYRLNQEHPPLVKDLAGLAISRLHFSPEVFFSTPWMREVNGQWDFGRLLIFNSGVNADLVKNLARLPELIFYFVLCWLVWRWAYERSGPGAACMAVTIAAFSPTILAHARLVTTDVAAAAGVIAATYTFVGFLKKPTRNSFLLAAGVLGLALLCKFNNVLLGPFFLFVGAMWGLDGQWFSRVHWRRAARMFGWTTAVGVVAVLGVVWPVYIIQTWHYPIAHQINDTRSILGPEPGIIGKLALWASDKPVIRALGHFDLGVAMATQREAGGNTIYWLGTIVQTGGPLYFPLVYLLKEPLPWLILIVMALASLIRPMKRNKKAAKISWWTHYRDEWIWLSWLVLYWGVSIHSTLNIGIRHLLPVYPFMILLVSGRISATVQWLHERHPDRVTAYNIMIAVLLGWYVAESVAVFPSYLSYFNELAGGPSGGYRYVVDSNLDWGQDLKRFATWTEQQGIAHIYLDYFGWSDPSFYLKQRYLWTSSNQWKNAADFLAHNQSDGWIAVSVTFFQNANGDKGPGDTSGTYRWLLNYTPITTIGHSIFVWHITN